MLDHLTAVGLRREQPEVLDPDKGEWIGAWRVTEIILRRLATWSGSTRVPVVLVIDRNPCLLHAQQCGTTQGAGTSIPHQFVASIGARSALHVLDLLTPFCGEAGGRSRYPQGNIRWAAAGHHFAAEAVAESLRSLGPSL